jgi:hypothetical protein
MGNEYMYDEDEVTKSCDEETTKSKGIGTITYVLCIIVFILVLIILYKNYGAACFQGAFPSRSDIGADKFDLQQEVSLLNDIQRNNLGGLSG